MMNKMPERQELSERLVACVSYQGNFAGKPEVFARLFSTLGNWARPKGLISPASVFLASYADDPKTTPPDELRLDVCMDIPEDTEVNDDEVHKKVLPGGSYAVMQVELAGSKDYESAWNILVEWAQKNHYIVDMSKPSYEIYLNNPEQHPQKHQILDFCLSVSPKE